MYQILDKFLLKDKIEYKGSVEDLKKKINESRGRKYDVEWISHSELGHISQVAEVLRSARPRRSHVPGAKQPNA